MDPFFEKTLLSCLEGRSYNISQGSSVLDGVIEGPLIGGNLELITALLGTPYSPSFKGSILLIEEVRTEPYQIDCMLWQLRSAGVLDQVAGVIFSHLEKCEANYFPDRDGTSEDVITEYASFLSVPCIKNFRYGHGPDRSVLPLGHHVKLDATGCAISVEF